MPFIIYKNAKIHYSYRGKGPTVILLHGFLETESMWRFFLPELSKKNRIVSIDLPGHGLSDCLSYTHTMEDMAEVVNAILKEINVRKVKLVGHSMGGYVALAFADLFPNKTKGVCLFFSTSRADSALKKRERSRAIKIIQQNHKAFIRSAFLLLFRSKYRRIKREEINAAKKVALTTSKQGMIAAIEGMKRRLSREILLKFAPFPIHIISGLKDPVISIDSIKKQVALSSNISSSILSESGHMGHIETPEECLKELLWFIKQ